MEHRTATYSSRIDHLHFYLYIHARWQIERSQSIDRLGIRIKNIDDALVDSHLKLLTSILMHKG